MELLVFVVVLGVLVGSVLLCYGVGFSAGRRKGAKDALREFMHKLNAEDEMYRRVRSRAISSDLGRSRVMRCHLTPHAAL